MSSRGHRNVGEGHALRGSFASPGATCNAIHMGFHETHGARPLRVLILGGGGRDHALAWAMAQSSRCGELHAAPGNPGMAGIATCHEHVRPDDIHGMVALAEQLQVDLVVVGAEDLLVAGVGSMLAERNIPCFGPSAAAAQLEGSKQFAKSLMDEAGIPTARWESCDSPAAAHAAIRRFGGAVAVKTDGLAAGCGAFVCRSAEHADHVVSDLMVRRIFGAAGDRVIVEELVRGHEVSVMAITDGTNIVPLPPARDYKRLLDGDRGPNTGGMGAHAPSHDISDQASAELAHEVIGPIVAQLAQRGTPFRGVVYAGLMLDDDGYHVLEYNCRFGNPETQALVRIIDADLLDLMHRAAAGSLAGVPAIAASGASVAVCVATPGYPELQLELEPITVEGIDRANDVPGVVCFTSLATPGAVVGSIEALGGRAVTISAHAHSMDEAIERAYEAASCITLEGARMRHDVGACARRLTATH